VGVGFDNLADKGGQGYSTWQLAERGDFSQSLITTIENGKRFPSLPRLWELSQALEGDFSQALFFLCVDLGIPEEAVKKFVNDG
jgi:transcriptional regulator with XRE-family HTH domain